MQLHELQRGFVFRPLAGKRPNALTPSDGKTQATDYISPTLIMTTNSQSTLHWRLRTRFALVIAGGLLNWLGFAGTDIWPLNFISYLPLLLAIDPAFGHVRKRAVVALAFTHGFVKYAGGYYWLTTTLEHFSGFPLVASALVASIFYAYLGVQHILLAFVYRFLRNRCEHEGFSLANSAAISLVSAGVFVEAFYPQLFKVFIATGLHQVPLMIQSADLGGPSLISALLCLSSATVFGMLLPKLLGEKTPKKLIVTCVTLLAANLIYGAIRLAQVDSAIDIGEHKKIAAIQVNMGMFAKHEDISSGHRRHLTQSAEIERAHPDIDLLVWPESAFTRFIPKDINSALSIGGKRIAPVLLGTLSYDDAESMYNTALLIGENGSALGMYDKVKLLAFAEYMPFAETFPILRDISPRSGRFKHGENFAPLQLEDGTKIAVLICYEDIPPEYSRDIAKEFAPDYFINITNDSWFGDTTEPWIHLALAKFRSIEHRRSLVRSTNSGVSAMVDPAGRSMAESKLFERDDIVAELPLFKWTTLYTLVGDWPGWLSLLIILLGLWRKMSPRPQSESHQQKRKPQN